MGKLNFHKTKIRLILICFILNSFTSKYKKINLLNSPKGFFPEFSTNNNEETLKNKVHYLFMILMLKLENLIHLYNDNKSRVSKVRILKLQFIIKKG